MRRRTCDLGRICLACCFLFAPLSVRAQSHGYAFVGGGFAQNAHFKAFRFGFGGAVALTHRITVGGEVERVGSDDNDMGFPVLTGNIGFHFLRGRRSGFDPFVAAGITGVVRDERAGNKGNIGAGTNYWFHRHIGFRADLRGYLGGDTFKNFGEVRAGLCFR
jgi:hypothetical protein